VVLLAWSATIVLATVAAVTWLLRAASRGEASVKNGYRWLAVAAGCLGGGAAAQQSFGGLIGGAQPLRLADLISLAALPALIIGLATLTARYAASRPNPGRTGRGLAVRVPSSTALGMAVDSCLLVAALFVISFVTVFGWDYQDSTAGAAAFAVHLIRPAADLITLGFALRFVARNPRWTALPALALVVVAVGDSLAVAARVSGTGAGTAPGLAVVAALGLLVANARPGRRPAASTMRSEMPGGPRSNPAARIALAAAAMAAVAVTVVAVTGGPVTSPAVAVAGAFVVLLLVIRLALLARQASLVAASAADPNRAFRALADSAIDAVVLCDMSGVIEYASRSVAEFGYHPGHLAGARLVDLVHPEDRLAARRAALASLREASKPQSFAGRVRGADGSWRHIESTLSRYAQPGDQARLLVTARDVSDRVALRREVAHLTFHDSLTGLPNRAYLEQRLTAPAQAGAEEPGAVAAIMLDLDGYASVNDLVGRSGGDLILAQVGRRLRAAAPPEATVARWDSDAFAVLVSAADQEWASELAQQLADRISAEPFTASGTEVAMTASVGVALSGEHAELVLGAAQLALTRAKEAGGGQVEMIAAPEPARPRAASTVSAEH
jgi:diguanylate cyclase (GGDEF)-like protein/PAS domain S-box-containing protein